MQDHFVNKPHHAQLHGVACCTYDTGIGHLYTSHSLENPPKLIGKHFFLHLKEGCFCYMCAKSISEILKVKCELGKKKKKHGF